MKKIELSDKFTYKTIIQYSLPAIITIIVTTSFGLVDGYFVSNLLGVDQFAAVNLIFPFFIIFPAAGYMIGSGGSAVISDTMGKGNKNAANEQFSMCVALTLVIGVVLAVIGYFLLPALITMSGAREELHEYCMEYGGALMCILPAFMINVAFYTLWITAEKPWLGFAVSVINGVVNVLLDWLFIGGLGMDVMGAGLATAIANLVAALLTIVYFLLPNRSTFRLRRFKAAVLKEIPGIMYNGASEMLGTVAGAVGTVVVNARVLEFFGETGVDALGIFGYIFGVLAAFFYGISNTSVTVIGYKHGSRSLNEIKAMLKRGIILMFIGGVFMFSLCELLAEPFAGIFVGYDEAAHELAVHSLRVQAATFILFGFNIYVTAVFTGLGDGLSSMIIALSQTIAAPIIFVFLLPVLFGEGAVWYTIVAESVMTGLLAVIMLNTRFRKSLMKEKTLE